MEKNAFAMIITKIVLTLNTASPDGVKLCFFTIINILKYKRPTKNSLYVRDIANCFVKKKMCVCIVYQGAGPVENEKERDWAEAKYIQLLLRNDPLVNRLQS